MDPKTRILQRLLRYQNISDSDPTNTLDIQWQNILTEINDTEEFNKSIEYGKQTCQCATCTAWRLKVYGNPDPRPEFTYFNPAFITYLIVEQVYLAEEIIPIPDPTPPEFEQQLIDTIVDQIEHFEIMDPYKCEF